MRIRYDIIKFPFFLLLAIAVFFVILPHSTHAYTLLRTFTGTVSDGTQPNDSLTLSGSTLYGMTNQGGASGSGTIFSINTSGTGFTLLHTFTGGNDGANPNGSLILSGSTLYGMTNSGGSSGVGTIFSINTSGTGFTVLYTFTGGNDGANPNGSLILSGSTLYGMTSAGGSSSLGTIFSINTSGTGFTLLHTFLGGANDGSSPNGSLTLSGSTLYGMTNQGGGSNKGTIFSINTDGTSFTFLHSFTGGASDGAGPNGSLTLSGSTLYGMTYNGGSSDFGTIFSINTSGTGFTLLHTFTGGSSDGSNPLGSLMLSGSTLYGMTPSGGSSGSGTIFSINTSGTGFTLLHTFLGGANDGSSPNGSLTLSGSTLYGMANAGGSSGSGATFSINTNGTGFTVLYNFGSVNDGAGPQGSLTLSGSTLYGMTDSGGSSGSGTIFSINTDGTGYTLLHTFTGGSSDGSQPLGSLTLSGSTLYGMTDFGGSSGNGVIFSINTNGTGFTLLHTFAGGASDGAGPQGSLTLSGSTLYGTTGNGGSADNGVIFSISTSGTGFTLLHTFAGGASDGSDPNSFLTLSGSTLYGVTQSGGSSNFGTIFSINTDGTGFTLLHTFTGGASDGTYPYDSLILSGSALYGVTQSGGTSNKGIIFSINTDGTGFTVLHTFLDGPSDGANPIGSLTLSGSTLYGTTQLGGSSSSGTIFSINTSGTGFTVLYTFTGGNDGSSPDGSLTLSGSTLYGMANAGGSSGVGVIFSTSLGITLSGTVYTNEGTTTMGSGRTVEVSINGAASAGSATTASDGTYTISSLTINPGDVLTLYLQGNTEKGVTVTTGTGSNMTGIDIYQNDLVVRSDNGGSFTGANMNTSATNADTGISAIYSASNSTTTTLASGKNLYLASGQTYAPGTSSTITVPGNFTNKGTFTPAQSTLTLTGTNQKVFGNTTFYNLTKDISSSSSDTLMFQNSDTQTFASGGTLTLKGATGKTLTLRSMNSSGIESDGTQFKFAVNGNQLVTHVDVKDSDASTGTTIASINSTNSGNNLHWTFGTAPLVSAGSNQTTTSAFTTSASASDSDSSITSYLWSYTGTGSVAFQTPTNLNTLVNATPGTYTVKLTATDAVGDSSSGSFTLTWNSASSSSSAGGGGSGGGGLLALLSPSPTPMYANVSATITPTPSPTPLLSAPPTSGGSHPYFPRYLGRGDHGPDVLSLQELLVTLGFFPSTITPNGYYGPATVKAVKLFQKAHGIRATGNVGPLTRATLQGE